MKMEDGYIKVDIYDLFGAMTDEQKHEFLISVSWQEEVWEDIKNAIETNYASSNYDYNIHKMRKYFVEISGELTKKYMEAMLRDLDRAEKQARYYQSALWETQRYVNDQQSEIPYDMRIKTKKYDDSPHADWNVEEYVKALYDVKKEEELELALAPSSDSITLTE